MKISKINYAIAESLIFIEKAKRARRRLLEDEMCILTGCRETATMKRASMDLTHALADLRNPNK